MFLYRHQNHGTLLHQKGINHAVIHKIPEGGYNVQMAPEATKKPLRVRIPVDHGAQFMTPVVFISMACGMTVDTDSE